MTIVTADHVLEVLRKVRFAPSCIDMGWTWEVTPAHGDAPGFLLRTSFRRPDRDTGLVSFGFGRWWHVSEPTTENAIVKTAFAAAKMILEHELMESFHYGDVRLFDPHHDLDDLRAAAASRSRTSEAMSSPTEDVRESSEAWTPEKARAQASSLLTPAQMERAEATGGFAPRSGDDPHKDCVAEAIILATERDAARAECGRLRSEAAPPLWQDYEIDTDDVCTLDGFDGVCLMTGDVSVQTGLRMSRETARTLADRLDALLLRRGATPLPKSPPSLLSLVAVLESVRTILGAAANEGTEEAAMRVASLSKGGS